MSTTSKPDLKQFEFGTIKRSQIKFADYNPRLIDEGNLKKLVKNIRANGLIEPVVWNKRTGVLVGGHQRLTAADKIYRGKDYDVPVAVIDVDEKQEKLLNVQLNNPSMQGEWNLPQLAALNVDDELSFDDMGFDKGEIAMLFGDDLQDDEDIPDGNPVEATDIAESRPDDPTADIDPVEDEKDKLASYNAKKANFRHQDKDATVIDFYVKVVFPDNATKREVFKKCSIPDYEQYVKWDDLKRYFAK